MEKTFFIKPSRPVTFDVNLDPIVVAKNKANGIETSITLDTNILVRIENVVKNGNTWSAIKKNGLHNLVRLLQRCPRQSVCISPGLALNEMPPALAEQSQKYYELFCAKHLPGFVDTPTCIHTSYTGKKTNYGYDDLLPDARAVLAVHFSCILYLNLVEQKFKAKPIEKFIRFLDLLEEKVDILTTTEIEIAKYCFAEPSAGCQETIRLRKKIRNNFLKTKNEKLPKSMKEVMQVAFNSACDIHMLHAANLIDQIGVDGVKQDSWIATRDEKLVEFCSVFHHVNIDGSVGNYSAKTIHPEHQDDAYWIRADMEFSCRSLARREYHASRNIEIADLLRIAEVAMAEVRQEFGD